MNIEIEKAGKKEILFLLLLFCCFSYESVLARAFCFLLGLFIIDYREKIELMYDDVCVRKKRRSL